MNKLIEEPSDAIDHTYTLYTHSFASVFLLIIPQINSLA
jgi:hypothetical protein